ncbi:carcinoembryonic antigen-related cell adhesion molecule 3-like [Orycteropus afer afer]|uniref:Carcinoembryonic antigen-related cell adhesion molecule 3-like n=1 Tax=Orycteropus afer afer TaxID=1230840 RepID=A0AC54ZAL3_ORYAF|nr:carcinoembryonic antigen-related cell adhesion molecule 3-like [Orycteropus afer afer]
MVRPSAPPHKGGVPWPGPLLTVSLLTFWNLPLAAQLTIESMPVNAAKGKSVLLLVHYLPENPYGYSWYKGEQIKLNHQILAYVIQSQTTHPGVAHSGRETIYPNGTLLFQNVTEEDSGTYTLRVLQKNLQSERASGQFRVYPQEQALGLSSGAIAGIVTGVLVGVAVAAALGCFLFFTRTGGACSQGDLGHQRPPASTSRSSNKAASRQGTGQSHSTAQTLAPLSLSQAPLYGNQAAVPIYEELLNHDTNIYCQINSKAKVAP